MAPMNVVGIRSLKARLSKYIRLAKAGGTVLVTELDEVVAEVRLSRMIDELEDIRAFDAALARPDRRMIPFEVTSAILDGAGPIRAWREHRGMGLDALAKAAGIESARPAKLEAGTRKAAPNELRRLAQTLGVQVDDLSDPPSR